MTESISESISESLAAGAQRSKLSPAMAAVAERLLVDVAGLCVAARKADYVQAALAAWEADGGCTAIGHARKLDAAGGGVVNTAPPGGRRSAVGAARRLAPAGPAFVNGTAAHGEDFDDTFEGGPVHSGAVIVPA